MSSIEGFVGDVKGVIILDNEGARVMAKYYNNKGTFFETLSSQKSFERTLFQKSNKVSGSSRSANSFEIFKKLGFKNIVHMDDGILGWKEELIK